MAHWRLGGAIRRAKQYTHSVPFHLDNPECGGESGIALSALKIRYNYFVVRAEIHQWKSKIEKCYIFTWVLPTGAAEEPEVAEVLERRKKWGLILNRKESHPRVTRRVWRTDCGVWHTHTHTHTTSNFFWLRCVSNDNDNLYVSNLPISLGISECHTRGLWNS